MEGSGVRGRGLGEGCRGEVEVEVVRPSMGASINFFTRVTRTLLVDHPRGRADCSLQLNHVERWLCT
jgi:hypothetical protein